MIVPNNFATYFSVFDVALASAAFAATYLRWFKDHWRGVTMALCLAVILSRTLMGLAMDEDEPVLLALFALVLGTAMLVPWDLRWELGVMGAGLASFTMVSLLGAVDLDDIERWLILAATMAFAVSLPPITPRPERKNGDSGRFPAPANPVPRAGPEKCTNAAAAPPGCPEPTIPS